jgi:kynureninase
MVYITPVVSFTFLFGWRRYDPADALIEVKPRDGEDTIRTEDILATIATHGDTTALVLFGGMVELVSWIDTLCDGAVADTAVQYYTGQYFDIEAITKAAHEHGCYAGFDCAHAAGW